MPSIFAGLAIEATASVDEIMAEAWQLFPRMEAPDRSGADIADPSRTGATINAVFLDPPAKPLMPNAYDPRTVQRPGVSSGHPYVKITPAELARIAPVVVQRCDLLLRQSTGIRYRVHGANMLAGGTLKCEINLVG